MNVHVFITTDNAEIRILYEDFEVTLHEGQADITPYGSYDLRFALSAHQRSSDWEQLL